MPIDFASTPFTTTTSNRDTWTIPIAVDFIEQRLNWSEQRLRAQYEADQRAIETAKAEMNDRLDVMNKFRETHNDLVSRMISRAEFEAEVASLRGHSDAEISSARERLDATIKPIQDTIANIGKPNWMLLIGIISIGLSVIGGCWIFVNSQVNNAIAPMALSLEQMRTAQNSANSATSLIDQRLRAIENSVLASTAADAESRTDRVRINSTLDKVESALNNGQSERRATEARFSAALAEIETQFCSEDTVRNLMHANDLRYLSLLWTATHPGEHLPTDNATYPQVCNRTQTVKAP